MAESLISILIEENRELKAYKDAMEKADWQGAWKELNDAHDKIQSAYQNDHCKLLAIKEIAKNTIAKRPHSDNTIFENILKIIKE